MIWSVRSWGLQMGPAVVFSGALMTKQWIWPTMMWIRGPGPHGFKEIEPHVEHRRPRILKYCIQVGKLCGADGRRCWFTVQSDAHLGIRTLNLLVCEATALTTAPNLVKGHTCMHVSQRFLLHKRIYKSETEFLVEERLQWPTHSQTNCV